jgi:hypothetical protein
MFPPATRRTLGVARLQDVAAGAAAHGLHHELAVVVGGEHDDADLGMGVAELPRGLEAVHLGHADVDQRDVGILGGHQVQELATVGRLTHHFDPVGHVEVTPESLAYQRMVIGDRDPDRHASLRP